MTIKIGGRKINAIILDLERTLYPSKEADRIFASARKQLAVSLITKSGSAAELTDNVVNKKINDIVTLADQIGWSKAYRQLGGDLDFYHRTVRGIDRSSALKFNQGLHQMLSGLKDRVHLGLLTNATIPTAEAICTKVLGNKWRDLFHAVVCDGTPGCPAEKPDPRVFEFTLRKLGVVPERTAMVGDSLPDDIVPASNLGILTIYVGDQDGIGDLRISRVENLSTLIDTTP